MTPKNNKKCNEININRLNISAFRVLPMADTNSRVTSKRETEKGDGILICQSAKKRVVVWDNISFNIDRGWLGGRYSVFCYVAVVPLHVMVTFQQDNI
ncbi:hypothetical protein CDAR_414831 [Caerostris darwini]|uniref:Uncharacterized protein n=1 Tax=Caerostris darwini TaxID=1538125 RepID=A0AAV4RFE8_9ARAC|nr:hypothetical protein CDAR_414831 [Caerostris darwini]